MGSYIEINNFKKTFPFKSFGKKLILFFVLFPVLIFICVTIALVIIHINNGTPFSYRNNGTDLTFQSSDGCWSDEEDLLRGKDFKSVLVSFELYKIKCEKPDIVLWRTKQEKKPWNWAWWFDDYNAAKWKVPYRSKLSNAISVNKPCYTRETTSFETDLAQQKAQLYIARLSSQN